MIYVGKPKRSCDVCNQAEPKAKVFTVGLDGGPLTWLCRDCAKTLAKELEHLLAE